MCQARNVIVFHEFDPIGMRLRRLQKYLAVKICIEFGFINTTIIRAIRAIRAIRVGIVLRNIDPHSTCQFLNSFEG